MFWNVFLICLINCGECYNNDDLPNPEYCCETVEDMLHSVINYNLRWLKLIRLKTECAIQEKELISAANLLFLNKKPESAKIARAISVYAYDMSKINTANLESSESGETFERMANLEGIEKKSISEPLLQKCLKKVFNPLKEYYRGRSVAEEIPVPSDVEVENKPEIKVLDEKTREELKAYIEQTIENYLEFKTLKFKDSTLRFNSSNTSLTDENEVLNKKQEEALNIADGIVKEIIETAMNQVDTEDERSSDEDSNLEVEEVEIACEDEVEEITKKEGRNNISKKSNPKKKKSVVDTIKEKRIK